jgi:hypothetical protein
MCLGERDMVSKPLCFCHSVSSGRRDVAVPIIGRPQFSSTTDLDNNRDNNCASICRFGAAGIGRAILQTEGQHSHRGPASDESARHSLKEFECAPAFIRSLTDNQLIGHYRDWWAIIQGAYAPAADTCSTDCFDGASAIRDTPMMTSAATPSSSPRGITLRNACTAITVA